MTSSLKRLVSSRVTFYGWPGDDLWIEIKSSFERRGSIGRKVTSGFDAISNSFVRESVEERKV